MHAAKWAAVSLKRSEKISTIESGFSLNGLRPRIRRAEHVVPPSGSFSAAYHTIENLREGPDQRNQVET